MSKLKLFESSVENPTRAYNVHRIGMKYTVTTIEKRELALRLYFMENHSIKSASLITGINYTTLRSIIKRYKNRSMVDINQPSYSREGSEGNLNVLNHAFSQRETIDQHFYPLYLPSFDYAQISFMRYWLSLIHI
eukprot:TRINITY_DN3060_c0_g1_i7.p1 TRINITY_DN3060_c0_g1~~TRINITY_DN3060_c0_g1_i7.p1  ORF type:complete len:157 (+),score=3.90 TRINITY_DN3060_c0_g1_i7:67-471(+)